MTYNQASLPDARASKPLGATDPGDRGTVGITVDLGLV